MDKIRKFLSNEIQTGELKELLIFWPQLSLIVFQVGEQIPQQRYFCLFQFSIENSPVEKKNRFHEKNRMLVFCYNYIHLSIVRSLKTKFLWPHIEKSIILFRYSNLPRRILRSRKLLHIENNGDCCWQFNSSPKFRGDLEYAKIGFSGLPRRSPKSIRRVLCDIVRRHD